MGKLAEIFVTVFVIILIVTGLTNFLWASTTNDYWNVPVDQNYTNFYNNLTSVYGDLEQQGLIVGNETEAATNPTLDPNLPSGSLIGKGLWTAIKSPFKILPIITDMVGIIANEIGVPSIIIGIFIAIIGIIVTFAVIRAIRGFDV